MDNNDSFKMTYSAEQREEISRIRNKYVPQVQDKMEQLRALDAEATQRATMYSIIVGVIGALVMGTGMSLAMTDFGAIFGSLAFYIGIAIGVVGMVGIAAAYPVYIHILKKERDRIAPEIIRLSDELLK